jgi:2-polyprenyl-3-methyl-5-hydroxy-6-metoxy-1,4-benzoquinol methylase
MSGKFSIRSNQSELLDAPDIPKELLFQNLRELDLINKTLGGHAITLAGIKALITDKYKTYNIIDIGCGGGDAIKEIAQWSTQNNFKVKITGVDMNADCIEYMKQACSAIPFAEGIVMDYRDYLKTGEPVDIIHCSLFCHHLTDDELIELFQYMDKYAASGFVINDLQRHWFAYYSIKFLTLLLNGSALVKNDAPVSVLRGFRKRELESLMQRANVTGAKVDWKWAFRYLIIRK